MPNEPVRRGGRVDPTLLKQETEAAHKAKLREQQELNDVRELMHLPAFHRYLRKWLEESGAFAVAKVFTAEGYWINGRRELGVQMWNQACTASPEKVLTLLDLTARPENPTE